MIRMCDLKPGQKGRILFLETDSPLRERLFIMGLTPGCVVEMVGKAPFGSPLIFRLRGYSLALRKKDLEKIGVALL